MPFVHRVLDLGGNETDVKGETAWDVASDVAKKQERFPFEVEILKITEETEERILDMLTPLPECGDGYRAIVLPKIPLRKISNYIISNGYLEAVIEWIL